MSRQAIVGVFTLGALVALFAIFFVLANLGTRGRYRVGRPLQERAGLHKGALVYESGVNVGIVDTTILQPDDFTVEVILAINNNVDIPRDARFIVSNPITGDVTLEIVPPAAPRRRDIGRRRRRAVALLPREILPIDQQPQGTNPPTIDGPARAGPGRGPAVSTACWPTWKRREPRTAGHAAVGTEQRQRADDQRQHANQPRHLPAIGDGWTPLSVAIDASGRNIVDLTGKLDTEVAPQQRSLRHVVSMLDRTSVSLNQTVDAVRDLATNPPGAAEPARHDARPRADGDRRSRGSPRTCEK